MKVHIICSVCVRAFSVRSSVSDSVTFKMTDATSAIFEPGGNEAHLVVARRKQGVADGGRRTGLTRGVARERYRHVRIAAPEESVTVPSGADVPED